MERNEQIPLNERRRTSSAGNTTSSAVASLTTAAIYMQNRAMTAQVSDNGRDYLRSVVDVKWMMSRVWFVDGGYQYTWQQYREILKQGC